MIPEAADAIAIARANEELRQERDTFDQRKRHENTWFWLRVAMGYTSILLLAVVMAVAGYMLLNPSPYSPAVLTTAGAALFVDVLGLLVGVWKIALNPNFISRLAPITRTLVSIREGDAQEAAASPPPR